LEFNHYSKGVLVRVLFVHELFPPDVAGGGELIVSELARGLRSKGVDVEVLTTGDPRITSFEGIPTHRLPVHRYLFNLAFPFVASRAKSFDIIQSFSFNASLPSYVASKFAHKPVVNFVMGVYGGLWKDMKGPVVGRLFSFLERVQLARNFDRTLFLSDFSMKIGEKIGVKKTGVVHPGVDARLFRPAKKEPFVLFVGRLSKQKGVDYLVEAAKALPEVKFVVVGEGEEGERLRSVAPANVEFKGWLEPRSKELLDLYSRALVFCMPSIGEGFGIVLLEAMASGCAIVSTVPLDYEGANVPPKSSGALEAAVRSLVGDPKKTEALGRRNAELSKDYSWDAAAEKLKKMYEELLKGL